MYKVWGRLLCLIHGNKQTYNELFLSHSHVFLLLSKKGKKIRSKKFKKIHIKKKKRKKRRKKLRKKGKRRRKKLRKKRSQRESLCLRSCFVIWKLNSVKRGKVTFVAQFLSINRRYAHKTYILNTFDFQSDHIKSLHIFRLYHWHGRKSVNLMVH